MQPLLISANLADLDLIKDYIIEAGNKVGLPPQKLYKLRLAVDELVTNIITHGYNQDDTPAAINIQAKFQQNNLTLCLEDKAVPFNPLSAVAPDLTLPLEQRMIGGLGIELIKSSVDKFYYERHGCHNRNILTMLLDK